MSKLRVRLCLKDIYRYIAIGKTVNILGIDEWKADTKELSIKYEGSKYARHYKATDEESRREAIKKINKHISEVH